MKYQQFDESGYLMRLDPGDEVVGTIKEFYEARNFGFGFFWGIGSLEDPTLAHYRIDKKKYSEKTLKGIFEVTSLHGSTAVMPDGKVLPHMHVTLSDEQMRGFGGHLVQGKVSATMELLVRGDHQQLKKHLSEESGLNIWDLSS